jgi:hypothetical protein
MTRLTPLELALALRKKTHQTFLAPTTPRPRPWWVLRCCHMLYLLHFALHLSHCRNESQCQRIFLVARVLQVISRLRLLQYIQSHSLDYSELSLCLNYYRILTILITVKSYSMGTLGLRSLFDLQVPSVHVMRSHNVHLVTISSFLS